MIRDTTRYFLNSQQNYEVVCAETGGEALSHARENFDVILMDILLPDTNGMDRASGCGAGITAPSSSHPVWTILTRWSGRWSWAATTFWPSPTTTRCCWPASWRTSAGCRWTPPSPASTATTARPLRWTPTATASRRTAGASIWPTWSSASSPFSSATPYGQRAVPEDLGQGKPWRCAHGAGAHPQSAQQDRAGPGKAHLPEKCLGEGVCVPAGWPAGALIRAQT